MADRRMARSSRHPTAYESPIMVAAYRKSIGNASNCKDGAAPQKRPGFGQYTAQSEPHRQEAARSVSRQNAIAALRLGDGEVVGHVSNVPRITGFNRATCSVFPDWHVENVPHVKRGPRRLRRSVPVTRPMSALKKQIGGSAYCDTGNS